MVATVEDIDMSTRRTRVVHAIGWIWLVSLAVGSAQREAAAQADQLPEAAIRSADWEERRHGFAALIGVDRETYVQRGVPDLPSTVGSNVASRTGAAADRRRRLLIELLEVENETVAAKARTRRQRGVDELPPHELLTEDYVNYYADVIAAVAALRDARSVRALAGAITTGSMATGALIDFGTVAVGPVAQRMTDQEPGVRLSAARLLSEMLARSDQVAKDVKSRVIVKNALALAARDPMHLVRRRAIGGLVLLGDAESIAIVEELARSDAYIETQPGRQGRRPVREAAEEALRSRSGRQ
jgi:HEAT repeat protein